MVLFHARGLDQPSLALVAQWTRHRPTYPGIAGLSLPEIIFPFCVQGAVLPNIVLRTNGTAITSARSVRSQRGRALLDKRGRATAQQGTGVGSSP